MRPEALNKMVVFRWLDFSSATARRRPHSDPSTIARLRFTEPGLTRGSLVEVDCAKRAGRARNQSWTLCSGGSVARRNCGFHGISSTGFQTARRRNCRGNCWGSSAALFDELGRPMVFVVRTPAAISNGQPTPEVSFPNHRQHGLKSDLHAGS
jgi:hypothetical protein